MDFWQVFCNQIRFSRDFLKDVSLNADLIDSTMWCCRKAFFIFMAEVAKVGKLSNDVFQSKEIIELKKDFFNSMKDAPFHYSVFEPASLFALLVFYYCRKSKFAITLGDPFEEKDETPPAAPKDEEKTKIEKSKKIKTGRGVDWDLVERNVVWKYGMDLHKFIETKLPTHSVKQLTEMLKPCGYGYSFWTLGSKIRELGFIPNDRKLPKGTIRRRKSKKSKSRRIKKSTRARSK